MEAPEFHPGQMWIGAGPGHGCLPSVGGPHLLSVEEITKILICIARQGKKNCILNYSGTLFIVFSSTFLFC